MAATVSHHFPNFLPLFSHKLFSHPKQPPNLRRTTQHRLPLPPHFTLRASPTTRKTSRKVKSNEELCNELMEFLTEVGLPECHVPSLKELWQHGRKDLANIVRRRGYKRIRELLADSTKTDINGNAGNGVTGIQVAIDDRNDIVTGQDQKVNALVEDDFSLSSEVSVLESDVGSLIIHLDKNHNDGGPVAVESSVDLYTVEGHSEEVDNVDGNSYVSTRVPIRDNHVDDHSNMPLEISTDSSIGVLDDSSEETTVLVEENNSFGSNIGRDLNSDGLPSMPVESGTGLSSDESGLDGGQDGKVDNAAEEESLSTEVSVMGDHSSCSNLEPTHKSDHKSYPPLESPANSSLEEKVAKFMQNGDLETLEDNVYGVLAESDVEQIKGGTKVGNIEEVQLGIPTSEHSRNVLDDSDVTITLNLKTTTSEQLLTSTTVDPSIRDDCSSAEGLSSRLDKDLDVKKCEKEDQFDISNLKFMLHQKEMELSRLKEQVEKEKHALSMLQAKAETAISKAQKLVYEKDAELLAAEESLSGLVEVEIQYHGDGEIVEVTGSFNGWHHQIQMDPQQSYSIVDSIGLRKSRLWSTMLWLYPGIYEIKFIVDGQWKIDPQRESVTRGTICNNILRVDG